MSNSFQRFKKMLNRKNPRAKGFDYRSNAAYFVTICAYQKQHFFGQANASMEIVLSRSGQIIDECVKQIPCHFSGVQLDLHQIMPNHLHLIFYLRRPNATTLAMATFRNGDKGTVSKIIGSLKSACTKRIREEHLIEGPVWQRSFYDRIILREKKLFNARQYIADNPIAWCAEKR